MRCKNTLQKTYKYLLRVASIRNPQISIAVWKFHGRAGKKTVQKRLCNGFCRGRTGPIGSQRWWALTTDFTDLKTQACYDSELHNGYEINTQKDNNGNLTRKTFDGDFKLKVGADAHTPLVQWMDNRLMYFKHNWTVYCRYNPSLLRLGPSPDAAPLQTLRELLAVGDEATDKVGVVVALQIFLF